MRASNSPMRLPDDTSRLVVIGATGSGKTYAGLWHLSRRNYDEKPWIIYDFKIDKTINAIEGATHITFADHIPEQPGIYIIHPTTDDEDVISAHMKLIWRQENIGVFIDEGYMIGDRNPGFRYLLTQGRSKHIPMIICTQRPVWLDRFAFSEATFFQVFRLQNVKDISVVEQYVPYDLSRRLPQYNSYYYDCESNNPPVILSPVPDQTAILNTFDSKLRRLKKVV